MMCTPTVFAIVKCSFSIFGAVPLLMNFTALNSLLSFVVLLMLSGTLFFDPYGPEKHLLTGDFIYLFGCC